MATNRTAVALFAAAFLSLQCAPTPALADNQMAYQLLSADQAAKLPRGGGALGMDVGRAEQITDGGMTFELLRVNAVEQNSPGAQAGFKAGDEIIAIDGRVFASVAAFAAYVGSVPPGRQISLDYIPNGGGPQHAQRVGATVGTSGQAAPPQPAPAQQDGQGKPTGLSTGTKVAIGSARRRCSAVMNSAAFPTRRPSRPVPASNGRNRGSRLRLSRSLDSRRHWPDGRRTGDPHTAGQVSSELRI